MSDYLKPVGRPVRWLAAFALAVAALVLTALLALVVTIPARKPLGDDDLGKLAVLVGVLGGLLVASGWMFLRLVRGGRCPATGGR